jgi:hypothetical protein
MLSVPEILKMFRISDSFLNVLRGWESSTTAMGESTHFLILFDAPRSLAKSTIEINENNVI